MKKKKKFLFLFLFVFFSLENFCCVGFLFLFVLIFEECFFSAKERNSLKDTFFFGKINFFEKIFLLFFFFFIFSLFFLFIFSFYFFIYFFLGGTTKKLTVL